MQGADLWWHLVGGRWVVDNGAMRTPDPFSYTTVGRYWLTDAWLSDVLLYLWTHAFGLQSVAYWKWLLIVATWLIVSGSWCGSPAIAWPAGSPRPSA